MEKKYRFAVYSRKSRITERGESIENQGELCRRYIEGHFYECFRENTDNSLILYYEDEGFSGGNTNRPAFKRLMDEAKPLGITHIVCYRLDRISRSIGDFAKLIEELRRREIEFISIKEQFDTQTPIGRAMMYIASVFSQLERETIAERIRDNMTELAKSGRWLGGVTPTGYRSVRIKEKESGRVRYTLELCEEEVNSVRAIYGAYEEFGSLSMTEKVLKKRGILSKNGNFYTRETIKNILSNPVYAVMGEEVKEYFEELGAKVYVTPAECHGSEGRGVMAFNKTRLAAGTAARRQAPTAPQDRIIAAGEHRGIIEGPRWTKVQRELLARSRKKDVEEAAVKARGKTGLLAGALRCPLCGSSMGVKKGTAEGSFYYRCAAKYGGKGESVESKADPALSGGSARCRGENVNGAALDDFVIREAAAFLAAASGELTGARCLEIRENCLGSFSFEEGRSAAEKQRGGALRKLLFALERTNSAAACEAILKRIEELTENKEEQLTEAPAPQNGCPGGEPKDIIAEMLKKITLPQRRNVILTILKKIEILP